MKFQEISEFAGNLFQRLKLDVFYSIFRSDSKLNVMVVVVVMFVIVVANV